MKIKTLLLTSLLTLLIISCADGLDESLLHGSWKTVEWKVVDTGQEINNQMDFTFDSKRRYSVDYGTEKEQGRYWVAVDYLHTVEDGKAEKKVKIKSINSDTLQLEMNRGGRIERLVLLKQ